jgi:dTDP-4-amino-4,6-dideoxygalactose transaminase
LGIKDSSLAVLCSNATLAIQGFLQISSAVTWHIPSFTFAATVHAGIQSGKEVVLEDIDPRTWMISSSVVKNPKTEGLIPVLPFGAPLNSSEYSKLEHVLIDAAASIGGASAWINSIRENWGVVFSLHATKSFGIGEGGLVVFGSRQLADKFRSWVNFGFSGSRESLISATNAKLSEVQAAVGLAVMDNWDSEKEEWTRVRDMTDNVSEKLGIDPFQIVPKGATSSYWVVSHHDAKVISRIEISLNEIGVETRLWWSRGAHLMPAFGSILNSRMTYAQTETVGNRYLGLPFFLGMSQMQVDQIARTIVASQNTSS